MAITVDGLRLSQGPWFNVEFSTHVEQPSGCQTSFWLSVEIPNMLKAGEYNGIDREKKTGDLTRPDLTTPFTE